MNLVPSIHRVLPTLIGAKGDIRRITFTEGPERYDCDVPDDSLWNAVKDSLILAEYERAGIVLREARGTVIDAGAHVGLFSLRAATYASRVIALEPHPANFALLTSNLVRNDARVVEPRRVALFDAAGEIDLFEGRHTAEGSLVRSGTFSHPVTAVTLDEIVADVGTVDLLKLDIEGSEFSVLESASQQTLASVRAIVAELHLEGQRDRSRSIAERLASAGFDVAVLAEPAFYWRQSMRRVFRRWAMVENVTRLKLTILVLYTATALLHRILRLRDTAGVGNLMFLYAQRRRR